jgi:hypothetical protein
MKYLEFQKKKKDYEYVQLCYGKIVMRNAYVVFH